MRYFFEIQYHAGQYSGWQRQKNAVSIQEVIETSLQTFYRKDDIEIVGCGRTDTGVHASQYYFHIDLEPVEDPETTLYKLNSLFPDEISLKRIIPVHADAHARFDALSRSYVYHIHTYKSVFRQEYSCYLKGYKNYDFSKLNEFAAVISKTNDFKSFCKSKSENQTNLCVISNCHWQIEDDESQMAFHITADRFLRGMVRLLVGSSLNIARGQVTMTEIVDAIHSGSIPRHQWSVPAHGLYLREIRYPFIPEKPSDRNTVERLP